jgi:DNA-directed RNA polymerase II subunit RPB1
VGSKTLLKKRSGMPGKCVMKRINGKKGRMRGNLMGKRVDFSARTVISPDAIMNLHEIGVPEEVALKLTFQETVNSINMHSLLKRVQNGAKRLDGAHSYTTSEGKQIFLEGCPNPKQVRLQLGWKVERYMQNGDPVIFNRQPTLRKKSMMCHLAKIMPGKTFRLNLSCTGPYNGDFDGRVVIFFCLLDVTLVNIPFCCR